MATEESLDKFSSEIIKASEMLIVATSCLRSLYVLKSPSVDSFVKLRKEITNEAKIYSEKVLPTSNRLIRAVYDLCCLYDIVDDFDEFKHYLKYFVEEANEYTEICKLTLKLYKQILVEFKNKQDEVTDVLTQLELKTKHEQYEQKKQELMKSAKVKFTWAIGLALIPVVNVLVDPILFVKGNKDVKSAIAEYEEELLTVAAAEAIKGPLIISLTNLVSTFDYISRSFVALIDELNELKTINDDNSKKAHFDRMKDKGSIIANACRVYLSKIPDIVTNLKAIPDDYDKNYVQKWLSEDFD